MLVEELRERGINFRSLTDSIDTSTPMGRFFFHVMGAQAEIERELIFERTKAGLEARGINFRSLTDSIDTSTPMGRFFFHVMGAQAEIERELIFERTKAGLEAARAQGRIGGRRPKLTPEQWAQAGRLIASGVPRQKVAIIYDVGVSTLYKRFPAGDK